MWEQLLVSILLEKAGFHLENNYEETLNQYFLQNTENEFLLELEYISSDLEKSFNTLKKDCVGDVKKYNRHKFASIICQELEKVYDYTPLKEFVPCAYKLWKILPICQYEPPLLDLCYFSKLPDEKNIVRADTTYREMFRYYSEGFDRKSADVSDMSLQKYVSLNAGTVEPDFDRAEMLLGFKLNQSVRNFYSRAFAQKINGNVTIPEEGFTISIGNQRFDKWFNFNGIEGGTEIQLFPCTSRKSSPRFIRDHFYTWTGGHDFGERVLIGKFYTEIGSILIVINNQTEGVEWVDCGYGHYAKYEKNPNGILAEHIEQFLKKIDKLT
ncbi:MAG: hypothetical protein J6C64_04395 [Lachnospiraceae bacterium]|nr:hypothetical protein [Lachnospiraceae bacterium]